MLKNVNTLLQMTALVAVLFSAAACAPTAASKSPIDFSYNSGGAAEARPLYNHGY